MKRTDAYGKQEIKNGNKKKREREEEKEEERRREKVDTTFV